MQDRADGAWQADWNQPVPLSTKLVMVLADLEERKKLAFSPSFSAAEYVLYMESMYSCGTIASFSSSLWWPAVGCEDAKMSFRNLDDLCPSWWEILAPLLLLGAEGEMIAADWKHGIFPRKTSSRPRYSVTSRDASMAGGVTGRCEETLLLFFLFSRSVGVGYGGQPESEMVCASGSESCYFCAPLSHQKKCVLRSGLHTRAETVGPRETRPHGRSVQGFPNNFMSQTSEQTHTIEVTNGPPQDTDSRVRVGKF